MECEICALRSIMRQRTMLLSYQGQHIQHMQKALSQMNIQLGNVIADVVGETGQRILRAIIAGERDPLKLAELKHGRIQASTEQIAMALHGNWREEHLFALTQAVELFDAYAQALQRCDVRLESMLGALSRTKDQPGPTKRRHISKVKNAPKFDVRTYLFRICGVDLTAIDGIDTTTALKVIAEVGPDLSRFKSAKHFASWLARAPRSPGASYCQGPPSAPPTASPRRCKWPPSHFAPANPPWAPISAACVRGSTKARP